MKVEVNAILEYFPIFEVNAVVGQATNNGDQQRRPTMATNNGGQQWHKLLKNHVNS